LGLALFLTILALQRVAFLIIEMCPMQKYLLSCRFATSPFCAMFYHLFAVHAAKTNTLERRFRQNTKYSQTMKASLLFPKFFLSNGTNSSNSRRRKPTQALLGISGDAAVDSTPYKRLPDASSSSFSSLPSCSETTSSWMIVDARADDLGTTSPFVAQRSTASQGRTGSPRRRRTSTTTMNVPPAPPTVPLSDEMIALQNGDRRLVHQIRTQRLLQQRDKHAEVQNMLRGSRLPSYSSSISTIGSDLQP
jgi:hypothetical protein